MEDGWIWPSQKSSSAKWSHNIERYTSYWNIIRTYQVRELLGHIMGQCPIAALIDLSIYLTSIPADLNWLYGISTHWRNPQEAICHQFCTIQVQSLQSLGYFLYFCTKIEQKSWSFATENDYITRYIFWNKFVMKRFQIVPNNIYELSFNKYDRYMFVNPSYIKMYYNGD